MSAIASERASADLTRAERKERTRRRLLDGALALVAERGFAAVGLRELAREAGITPAAFYRHFANLDELGLVLVDESFGALGDMLREVRANRTPPADLVDASLDVLVRHLHDHRAHFRFLARELAGGHSAVRQAIRKELQLFRSELAVDLARLPFVRDWPTEDLFVLAELLVQIVVGTVQELLELPPDDHEAEARVIAATRTKLLLIMLGLPHWQPAAAR
ncbi:MAG TPA: TetR family transcriptional regulator [Acidimicrobiales bacterium]|nr:TetR family transcriptional regulator [Acidimicrobiales bacterium]